MRRGFASRPGGDEFVIFLPGTGLDAPGRSMARLRNAIDAAPSIHQHDVGVSIGIAGAKASATPLDALLVEADDSMYREKQRS